MDVWADVSVPRREWQAPTGMTAHAYELAPGLEVFVVDNATSWLPDRLCDKWRPIGSYHSEPTSAESCLYELQTATHLTAAFLRQHHALLGRGGLGAERCSWSNRRPYVTRLNARWPPDSWHIDGCYDLPELYVTVLAYPHDTWEAEWLGHTEFAALDCAQVGRGALRGAVATRGLPALRVAPRPHRMIAFNGRILHRATRPDAALAGISRAADGQLHGERYSSVLRFHCLLPSAPSKDGVDQERGAAGLCSAETGFEGVHWGGGEQCVV